jgi:hypothetical protein
MGGQNHCTTTQNITEQQQQSFHDVGWKIKEIVKVSSE